MKNKTKSVRKKDILLLLVILLIALLFLLLFSYLNRAEGDRVVVYEDGTEVLNVSLFENEQYLLGTYETEYNLLVVEDGYAFVSKASCPDLVCVHHKKINKSNETIVCLPRKLVIAIEGESAGVSELDAVAN